jgi:hypothetical protein
LVAPAGRTEPVAAGRDVEVIIAGLLSPTGARHAEGTVPWMIPSLVFSE